MPFLFLFIFRIAFVEKTRESDDEKKRKWERKRHVEKKNYHKLNAIKWIYILFAYITERADTSSCSPLNDEEMRVCYVHGARKRKKKELWRWWLMRSNSNLNINIYMYVCMHFLLISLPILMYKTFHTIEFIALIHNKCSIWESQKVSSS
jgi:hypothetical protein